MSFTNKSIRPYKGKLIVLKYINRIGLKSTLTGEITASTKYHFLFNVNKAGHEIMLKYDQIIDISRPDPKLKVEIY